MRRLLPLLLVLLPAVAMASGVSGKALVLTGDMLQINGQKIALAGIHAPVITETCGEGNKVWDCGWNAANRLEAIIAGRKVTCTDLTKAADGTTLGHCSAGGEDLAGKMIDEGLAVADKTTGKAYASRAEAAKKAGIGIWAGPFIDPVLYARVGGCSCAARKKAMLETANELKKLKAQDQNTNGTTSTTGSTSQ